jgi:uncharacterized membrane protein
MKKYKTHYQRDLRDNLTRGLWTGVLLGLFLGFIAGFLVGAILMRHNVTAWDIQETKDEIRITYEKMKLEQIKLDNLIEMLQSWQMEIDEIWLYYGVNLSTRVMASEEGRPSKED